LAAQNSAQDDVVHRQLSPVHAYGENLKNIESGNVFQRKEKSVSHAR
jgi:hypothetical protein